MLPFRLHFNRRLSGSSPGQIEATRAKEVNQAGLLTSSHTTNIRIRTYFGTKGDTTSLVHLVLLP